MVRKKIKKSASCGTKTEKHVRLGMANRVTNAQDLQLSERVREFLGASNYYFGKAVSDRFEEFLLGLPEKKQHDLIHMVIHYCFTEQIEMNDDVKLMELLGQIIELLPTLSVKLLQLRFTAERNSAETSNDIAS